MTSDKPSIYELARQRLVPTSELRVSPDVKILLAKAEARKKSMQKEAHKRHYLKSKSQKDEVLDGTVERPSLQLPSSPDILSESSGQD